MATGLRLGVRPASRDAERVPLGTQVSCGGRRRESMRKWKADPRQVNFQKKKKKPKTRNLALNGIIEDYSPGLSF